jgi:hypothetical protein
MRDILARLRGHRLDGVTEARHWSADAPGDTDEALVDFWLHFDGYPALHAGGDDSGTRLLLVFDEPYASYDMGHFGEYRVGPVADVGPLAGLVGHHLVDAAVLGADAGVWLRFDHRELIVLADDDDFGFVTDTAEVAAIRDAFGPAGTPRA